jgi:hypothetical protein
VNKKVLGRTLECDDGLTTVASFAGLEASDFNVTTDEHVSSPRGAAASALRDFRNRRPQEVASQSCCNFAAASVPFAVSLSGCHLLPFGL